jgi:2-keto-4-pentenoate hydratase/2-oxohepta-3-ene-1,7-dioic acid hydratase in catechol pathway
MRVTRYEHTGMAHWGVIEGDRLLPLPDGPFDGLKPGARPVDVADCRLLAPVAPGKLVCVGLNYRLHAIETKSDIPELPVLFMCSPEAIIPDGATILLDSATDRIDFEAEIGIVIGRRGRNISAGDAAAHILGYTCVNDVSNRNMQRQDGQWTRAKSFDTYKPVGPWIETGPIDAEHAAIRLTQNGIVRQSSNTADMIFPIRDIVAFVSGIMTLEPGDLIITGTPEGVGPMAAGDTVEIDIEGIGTLRNQVALA